MHNIDDLKKNWKRSEKKYAPFSNESFQSLYRTRIKKQNNEIMKYFWSSFVFQIILYGFYFHFIVKYGTTKEVLLLSVAGILIYLPYTFILMKRYKRMAILKVNPDIEDVSDSLSSYLNNKYKLLLKFYKFKKMYEWFLIPVTVGIVISLIYIIYFPGGLASNIVFASALYFGALIACGTAIYLENKRNFIKPLNGLQLLIDDLKEG